jgi:hypothetical protein
MTAGITRHHRATLELLNGRETNSLIMVTGTFSLDVCLDNLRQIDYSCVNTNQISTFEKAAIVGTVCGAELGFGKVNERVSNGVLAVALALLCGAAEVVFTGVSFTRGNSYMELPTRRMHVAADIEFLRLCGEKGLPVRTSYTRST